MIKLFLVGFCLLPLIAGCAMTNAPKQRTSTPSPTAARGYVTAQTEGPDLGAIDRFGIPDGRCGMVLYTQSGGWAVPIFRSTDNGEAQMEIEGTMTALALVGRGGETRMNVPSAQYFRSNQPATGQQFAVAIQTQWGQSFPGGSYVDDGTLTVTAADGWSRVVPVAGIAGCRG